MYLGIDYSSKKVAAARLDKDGRLTWIYSFVNTSKGTNAVDNLNELLDDYAQQRLVENELYYEVMVEAPIVGRSGAAQTAVNIAMTAGALVRFESKIGGRVRLAAPASWKKAVCGRGNLKKAEVAEWLSSEFPHMTKMCTNDDEVDAICLAMYAKHMSQERIAI